jgi:hypothetical protein
MYLDLTVIGYTTRNTKFVISTLHQRVAGLTRRVIALKHDGFIVTQSMVFFRESNVEPNLFSVFLNSNVLSWTNPKINRRHRYSATLPGGLNSAEGALARTACRLPRGDFAGSSKGHRARPPIPPPHPPRTLESSHRGNRKVELCDSFGHHTPHLSVHDYAMVLLGQQILLPLVSKWSLPITNTSLRGSV